MVKVEVGERVYYMTGLGGKPARITRVTDKRTYLRLDGDAEDTPERFIARGTEILWLRAIKEEQGGGDGNPRCEQGTI